MGLFATTGRTVTGKAIRREVGEYAIDNALVVIIILAAIALRVRDIRRGSGKKPILVRAIEAIPDGFSPMQIDLAKLLIDFGRKK